MQAIDAYWDSRNLGVKTAELIFCAKDDGISQEEVSSAAEGCGYCVAKAPVGCFGLYGTLGELGFRFAECSITFGHTLEGLGPTRTRHELAAGGEVERILQRVGEGLFETDRVYLDPRFSREQAAGRYVNWIRDELGAGALLFRVTHEEDDVGFFAYKEAEPGVSYPFLIGLYPEFRGMGLGTDLIAESLVASRERGCRRSSTVVSSNNPAVIRCHEKVGSVVTGMTYVFVRHA